MDTEFVASDLDSFGHPTTFAVSSDTAQRRPEPLVVSAFLAYKAREWHTCAIAGRSRRSPPNLFTQGEPPYSHRGARVICGAPKGIRNLTCRFQWGSTGPAECRIVSGQAACAVPAGAIASQPMPLSTVENRSSSAHFSPTRHANGTCVPSMDDCAGVAKRIHAGETPVSTEGLA